jgi:hypothetical protein
VRIEFGQSIQAVRKTDHGVQATLHDGSRKTADHVVVGTGYRVDAKSIAFLSNKELRQRLETCRGYPVLDKNTQSCFEGLYLTGAAAAERFWPKMWHIFAYPGRPNESLRTAAGLTDPIAPQVNPAAALTSLESLTCPRHLYQL